MITKLDFLHHPKLYLLAKLLLISSIIIQRIIFIVKNERSGLAVYYITQIAFLPIQMILEFLLLYYFCKHQTRKWIQIVSLLILQIIFSQGFVELSLQVLPTTGRSFTEVLFQEVLFLDSLLLLFTDSRITKGVLLTYIAYLSGIRFSQFEESLHYLSWSLMSLIFIIFTLIVIRKKQVIKREIESLPTKHVNFKLENEIQGVALINRKMQVISMNGLFKGLLECEDQNEALNKVLQMRKFESYSPDYQKFILNKIKMSKVYHPHHLTRDSKSFGDIPRSTSYIRSLEVPTPRPFARPNRPSIFQRTSIFQRNSIFNRSSFNQNTQPATTTNRKASNYMMSGSSKIDTITQVTSSRGPLIKINLSRAEEEQIADSIKPVWIGNESDSKSPLIHANPDSGWRDSLLIPKDSPQSIFDDKPVNGGVLEKEETHIYAKNVEYEHSAAPEHIEINIETQEKSNFDPWTARVALEAVFEHMDKISSERLEKLVWTEFWEEKTNPLDTIRKRPSLFNQQTGGGENLTVQNSGLEKFQVIQKDAKNGVFILEVTLSPFIYQGSDCVCISVRDVSYEMKTEELQEVLEHKDRVLRYVSHEFRTPLNGTLPILESMRHFDLPSEVLRSIQTAINSSKMLQVLANDLLDYAQIQARKFKITILPCKMKKLFEEIAEIMQTQAISRKTKIRLDWDNRIPVRFYTDPNRLRQILFNLISNALKFTIKGTVTVQAIHINATICKIVVSDTGIGISKENLKNLFQEFGRMEESFSFNPNGVGLGLVISRLFSQELGPDREGMTVDSEEGKGTMFSFLLESKIESFDELLAKNDDIFESLAETIGSPSEKNSTTYQKSMGASFSPRFRGNKSKSKERSKQKQKQFTLAPHFRDDSPASPTHQKMLHSFQRQGDNMNLILPPKKKSSDNIILRSRRSNRSTKNLFGKEIRAGSYRAYTLEDLNDSQMTGKNSDWEQVIKGDFMHQCDSTKILVVDDHIFNFTALEALLRAFGLRCHSAVNGKDAIDKVLENQNQCTRCQNYKIIFMDVEMPHMNGFETTKILREKMLKGEIPFIPIIGVTGHEPNENRVQCLTSGMMDLVLKPVTQSVVKELVMKWMGV